MNNNSKETVSSSFPFLGILTLIFITLKLIGSIGWSWWWVLSPIWIPWAVITVLLAIIWLVIKIDKRMGNL